MKESQTAKAVKELIAEWLGAIILGGGLSFVFFVTIIVAIPVFDCNYHLIKNFWSNGAQLP